MCRAIPGAEFYNQPALAAINLRPAYDAGLSGAGVRIGEVDTGINPNHVEFPNAIAAGFDAVTGISGTSFVTYGIEQSPWLARGGLGLVHKTKGGMEINVRYDTEYRTSFLNHSASIKTIWAF